MDNTNIDKQQYGSAGNHAPACAAHDGKQCNCGIGSAPLTSNQCPSCERALSLLQLYGVPPDRARTAANGIEVLMTRSRKEAVAVNSTIERLRAALLKICTSGTLFSQMPAIARDALDTTGLPDETSRDEARDAARYRWLRANSLDNFEQRAGVPFVLAQIGDEELLLGGDELDSEIDSAMQSSVEETESGAPRGEAGDRAGPQVSPPPPPDVLADALQDVVHADTGRVQAGRSVKASCDCSDPDAVECNGGTVERDCTCDCHAQQVRAEGCPHKAVGLCMACEAVRRTGSV